MAMVKPAPILKPTNMLSLINLTSALNPNHHDIRQSAANDETGKTCNLCVTLRVAVGHYAHSSSNHQRDGRGRPDSKMLR